MKSTLPNKRVLPTQVYATVEFIDATMGANETFIPGNIVTFTMKGNASNILLYNYL